IVHRLDLDTSGLLVVGRSPAVHAALQGLFAARRVQKRYLAVVEGHLTGSGVIELALRGDPLDRPRQVVDAAGKPARTGWHALAQAGGATRLALTPHTGRTHQLRVHCAHPHGLNAPIRGDRLYGTPADRLHLHAESLAFEHPVTGAPLSVSAPAPF
ncbi:MAG: RluA family pseudouridine synthase, partial [Myxococcales bacterium]|nr:RluA family pseudouridine synthase [Myxococcales bacterium]